LQIPRRADPRRAEPAGQIRESGQEVKVGRAWAVRWAVKH